MDAAGNNYVHAKFQINILKNKKQNNLLLIESYETFYGNLNFVKDLN